MLQDLAAAEASSDPAERTAGVVRASQAWQQRKFAGGWACLSWPKAFGGRGATPIERVIWDQEESPYAALSSIFQIGQGMCGPDLDGLRERRAEAASSPADGLRRRDLVPVVLRTRRGLRSGGAAHAAQNASATTWIVNGQKVWTTGAHFSDYGILIVRTDPNVAKHKGLTMFFLDMRSAGVEIRPIRQASGQSGFNEVYFTDVRIPDSQRLGKVGDGWNVSLTTLMNERFSIGSRIATGAPEMFELACDTRLADGTLAIDDPRSALPARFLDGARQRPQIQRLSHNLGPVSRRAAGAGELDRQARRRLDDAGNRDGRFRSSRPCGRACGLGQELPPASCIRCSITPPPFASPAAPTRSCATSSPSASSVCRRKFGWTRMCRFARFRPRDARGSARGEGKMKLDDSISAVVTGGASGLGRATAAMLASHGVKVAIFDLNEDLGETFAQEIGGVFCKADVTSTPEVDAAFAKARAANGQERILVNCAGTGGSAKTVSRDKASGQIREYPLENFERIININLIGTFRCITKSAAGMLTLPALPDGERGVIVNTASVAAEDGQIGQVAYTASKAGRRRHYARGGARSGERGHPLQHDSAGHFRHAAAAAGAGKRQGGARGFGSVSAAPRAAGGIRPARAHDDHLRLFQRRGRASRRRDPHGAALTKPQTSRS